MAAAEAKLSFDLAVDSVLDSLEPKFILKEERRSTTSCKQFHLLPRCLLAEFLSLYIRHLVQLIRLAKSYEQMLMIDICSTQ